MHPQQPAQAAGIVFISPTPMYIRHRRLATIDIVPTTRAYENSLFESFNHWKVMVSPLLKDTVNERLIYLIVGIEFL